MDTESWPRISSYSRRYQSRSDYHGEDYEVEEEQRPEYLCPFCAEDFDMVGLCCHIDEEHAIEAKNGVCPVCAKRVGSGLIRHLTVQHTTLLKHVQRRRRLRRGGSNFLFSNLRKELREGNVQSLLAGSSFLVPSSRAEPDSLLSSFISNSTRADDSSIVKPLSSSETGSMVETSADDSTERVVEQSPLSAEDLKEKARRCEFVQWLLLSTFLDDDL